MEKNPDTLYLWNPLLREVICSFYVAADDPQATEFILPSERITELPYNVGLLIRQHLVNEIINDRNLPAGKSWHTAREEVEKEVTKEL